MYIYICPSITLSDEGSQPFIQDKAQTSLYAELFPQFIFEILFFHSPFIAKGEGHRQLHSPLFPMTSLDSIFIPADAASCSFTREPRISTLFNKSKKTKNKHIAYCDSMGLAVIIIIITADI